MSADNWAICPKCALKPNPYYEAVPHEFREDYELGMRENGEFYVSYYGECQLCGFKKVFEHSEKLEVQS